MSAKRSITSATSAKLKVENFAGFTFAVYNPTQRNLYHKKLKGMLYLPKTTRIFKEDTQKMDRIRFTNIYKLGDTKWY